MNTQPVDATATDKTNKILVSVVLDRSGSMGANRAGTISGYNEYINGIRSDKDSEYHVTLIQFDSVKMGADLTVTYEDRALADVPVLTEKDYEPRGNTPLYDAVGECVRRTDVSGRAVIVLIITDGHENASREFSKDAIKNLIKQKESEGWTFTFLGANIDSYAVGGSIGVSAMNTANYTAGNEQALYSNLAKSTMLRAASARTVGMNVTMSMAMFDDGQRKEMEQPAPVGGRADATSSFRRAQPPIPTGKDPKPRAWNVNAGDSVSR